MKLRVLVGVAMALTFAVTANATPVVQGTATTADNVLWTYSYTVSNPEPTPGVVFDLYMPAWGNISDVLSPQGWAAVWGSGFVEWATDYSGGIPASGTLSGFSFQTDIAPVQLSVIQVSVDDGLPNSIYTYIVPGAVPIPIPEPTSLIYALSALGFGAGFLGLRQRRD